MQKKNYSFIKRGDFLIHKKTFSDKILLSSLDHTLKSLPFKDLKMNKVIDNTNILSIKTSLYILLKTFKAYKRKGLNSTKNHSLKSLNQFSLKLQSSGFYYSLTEGRKKEKQKLIREKLLHFYICCLFVQYNNVILDEVELATYIDEALIKKGFNTFSRNSKVSKFFLLSKATKRRKEIQASKSFSILQKKYTRILEYRFFLYFGTLKKKYKKLYFQYKKNKVTLRKLFGRFKKIRQTYLNDRKEHYKRYKKLAWKRKKRKNRKKTGLLRFLRRRRRKLDRFYVPRHLEINYKTFDIIHHGSLDLPTTNSRISFWLNLRRLLTFLSL